MTEEEVVRRYFPYSILFVPTFDNLESAIPVAKTSFREMLLLSGVHDFESQGMGKEEHGVEIPLEFLTFDEDSESAEWMGKHLSLYRAAGTQGERRFWIPGLKNLADPGDPIVIGLSDSRPLFAVNLSLVPNAEVLDRALEDHYGPTVRDSRLRDSPVAPTERATYEIQRFVRDSALISEVKNIHDSACQVCGKRLVGADGLAYAEGAHVLPLREGGPDVLSNILCLCPNHHVLLDIGAILITDDFVVKDRKSGSVLGDLLLKNDHEIDVRFVRKQRDLFETDQ